jgi:hypothetical protein
MFPVEPTPERRYRESPDRHIRGMAQPRPRRDGEECHAAFAVVSRPIVDKPEEPGRTAPSDQCYAVDASPRALLV